MPKLLQINPVLRMNTSTGRIMQEIGDVAMSAGWESFVAYSKGRDGMRESTSKTVPVGNRFSVAVHGLGTRLFDRHGLASNGATKAFIKKIEEIDPDIIHIHNIHGYFLNYQILFDYLSRAGKPVIWTIHDCWLYTGHCYYYTSAGCDRWKTGCGHCPQKRQFPASLVFDRSAQNFKDKAKAFCSMPKDLMTIVPVSEWMRDEMSESFLKDYRFRVIHNGIDTSIFMPQESDMTIREKYGAGSRKIILGLASIWCREKGWDDFIALSKALRDDEVIVMVGVKPDKAKSLPANIIPIARTENVRELAELYSAAEVFVNPTWQDNYPTVNLEAIACGTPVITYNTGGSIESVTPATGIVIPQAYVDEYFYNDKPYKDFVNTDDRNLSFTIGNAEISNDGHSSYIEGSGFTLKQKSIKTFYKDNVGNPFGFESVEETPAATFTGNDDYPGTELQNGLKNTWEIINTKTTKTWTDYVNIAQNGFTGATPPTSANIMTTDGTNPMFECLSRNRDLNGDGKIDEDEVRWYLPSVRQCIFAWCGKKSLPTEISFETTNYATSTNLGFRIWWALEGTAISSWSNMETNPMIRCVRNLGTNSTSGEVSDITSLDQENYVVTVNGLKDETLRTNMQIGEYPEHENFDAASTLPKAFKIASADLNIPASGEDTYAPVITVGELDPTGIPESQSNTTPHNITVPVTITNYDASKNYTYQIGTGNEVNVTSAELKVSAAINLTSTSNGATASTTIKIKSDNGNYTSFNVTVTLTTRIEGFIWQTKYYTYTYSKSTPQQTIVAGGTPAKNTFKYTEIMNGDWCEKYYQEGTDDLGKWRIPNEKELYFIQRYCGEEITGNLAGYPSSGTQTGTMRYAAKTKYERPEGSHVEYMIYYLQKDGNSGTPIITTGHGQSDADFTIRCVRDAPQGTRSYDSSYSSGGTGFGL